MDELEKRLVDLREVLVGTGHPRTVASKLKPILEFLSLPENNTEQNCDRASQFVLVEVLCEPNVCCIVDKLPEPLRVVIMDVGVSLDDAHGAPDIARSLESTPEQLLGRLEGWLAQLD